MLPKDPMILLSYVNTKLRDEYESFAELCAALDEDGERVVGTLAELGCRYDAERNQFI